MKALKLIINGEEHKLPKGVTSVNGKSGNVVLTTSNIPVIDDDYDYITSEERTEWNNKQDALTAGEGISIANKVISNTGVLTVNGEDGDVVVNDVKKSATAPANPTEGMVWYDTTNDILKTYDGTDWNEVGAGTGDMLYEDFEFATKTGNAITLSISSKVVNPTADFTINAPSTIKDGITYVLRVQNGATPPTMTLGTNITNPYNVNLSLSASKTDTFAFLAVDNKLELQPTEADVPDNVYTKPEVDDLLDEKVNLGDNNITDTTKVNLYKGQYVGTDFEIDGGVTLDPAGNAVLINGVDETTINNMGISVKEGGVETETYDFTGDDRIARISEVCKYEDFEFATMTGTVIESLSATKSISADTTLTAGTSLKEGMQYLVVVSNTDTAKHTVTFGTETIDVEAGENKQLVFLATSSSTLELQVCSGGGGGGGSTPGNGKLTINQNGTKKGEFTANQNTDVTVDIDADMSYEDFNFSAKTGTTVTLDLNTSISPSANITVNKPAELKEGQTYILRVSPTANMSVTLGSGITNPFSVDLSLVANSTNQFVFLATSSSTLELQPEMLTRDDIDEILRSYGLIS